MDLFRNRLVAWQICAYLDLKSMKNCRLVCSEWDKYLSEKSLWINLLKRRKWYRKMLMLPQQSKNIAKWTNLIENAQKRLPDLILFLTVFDPFNDDFLHEAVKIHEPALFAPHAKSLKLLKLLMKHDLLLDLDPFTVNQLLSWAVDNESESTDILQAILPFIKGKFDSNPGNIDLITRAVKRQHLEKVILLSPLLQESKGAQNSRPLLAAIQGQNMDLVQILAPYTDIDLNSEVLLREALETNNLQVFECIYALGQDSECRDGILSGLVGNYQFGSMANPILEFVMNQAFANAQKLEVLSFSCVRNLLVWSMNSKDSRLVMDSIWRLVQNKYNSS